jgi:hypothetical protein
LTGFAFDPFVPVNFCPIAGLASPGTGRHRWVDRSACSTPRRRSLFGPAGQ